MNEDKVFDIVKTIPLKDGGSIPAGGKLTRTHGVYYLNGGMLPKEYQQDFDGLVKFEEKSGWKYLAPMVTRTAWQNDKEDK